MTSIPSCAGHLAHARAADPQLPRRRQHERSCCSSPGIWRAGKAPENDSATASARWACAAWTISSSGICVPREMQCAPSSDSTRLHHQQPHAVLLVGQAGQQDPRLAAAGHGRDRLAQHPRREFGEEVLLEDLQAALLPGTADQHRQRSHRVLDKQPQTLSREPLLDACR